MPIRSKKPSFTSDIGRCGSFTIYIIFGDENVLLSHLLTLCLSVINAVRMSVPCNIYWATVKTCDWLEDTVYSQWKVNGC